MRGRRILTVAALLLPVEMVAQQADTLVKNVPRPLHEGVANLVREVRFGVADGAEEYLFGNVTEMAVDSDGSMYVYDAQVPALRKYDANGRFLRTFGRGGQGPGEYRSAGGLAILPDGRVLLWDSGNWRFNVYSRDGDVLPSWPTPSGATGASLGTSRALMVDTAGRIHVYRSLFGSPGTSRRVWIRYRDGGTPIDTIDSPEFSVPAASVTARSPDGRVTQSSRVPFTAQPMWAMSPLGHLITGLPSRYTFEIHTSPGSIVSVRRDAPARPVTRQERDSAREVVTERMRRVNPSWSWNGPDIPRQKPAYERIYVADDGRIWVALIPEMSLGGGGASFAGRGTLGAVSSTLSDRDPPEPRPALYDVFERDGTWLGQVEVPAGVRSLVRRGDHVWGVEIGDDDIPRVVRFRIAWR